MKKTTLLVLFTGITALFSFTTPKRPALYAPAKISVVNGRVHIQPLDKFKKMPDTTIYGVMIKGGR